MDVQRITYLYTQYLNGNLSSAEADELSLLANAPEFEREFKAIFDHSWDSLRPDELQTIPEQVQQQQVAHITSLPRKTRRIQLWPKVAIAAAVATVMFGVWFYAAPRHSGEGRNPGSEQYATDIPPGKLGATLTLANGKKIKLTDATNGQLAKEAGVIINKTADGQIVYEILKQVQDDGDAIKTNTLSTARGETYKVQLPDGSMVWLNAASTLKYPASFAKLEKRIVELSGEGYFEIAKDKAHPFIVESSEQQVEVLGTHFNINSYADEANTETTLLEGSVNVNGTILKPNQQSTVDAGKRISVKEVDASTVVAWKNNEFTFDGESIEEIMRTVARWYDVKVIYQGDRPKEKFVGGVSRFDNVSKVLKMLESTSNVRFKIEGRTIYVL